MREFEILDLIADGYDSPQIADTLKISETTVHNHVTNILQKVQLANRYRLTVEARNAGFGAFPDP
jgi:DNA-binding NarL/FixJ family response regulator